MENANTAQETQKFEVVLTSVATTIRVENDLGFVRCTVQHRLSSLVNGIFTYVGLGLAAAGVPLAITFPPVGGVTFALSGFAAAMTGAAWSYMKSDAVSYPAMPPGTTLGSSVLFGSFDAFVIRIQFSLH